MGNVSSENICMTSEESFEVKFFRNLSQSTRILEPLLFTKHNTDNCKRNINFFDGDKTKSKFLKFRIKKNFGFGNLKKFVKRVE